MKVIGRIEFLHGNSATLEDRAVVNQLRGIGRIRLSHCSDGSAPRVGEALIHGLDYENGIVIANFSAVIGAASWDYVIVERAHDDIATLEAYLAYCVRTRDWRAVINTAIELIRHEESA